MIDLGRFADLFAAESGEHLRLLSRSILALESAGPSPSGAALDEAFRAVHTIKGLAATMGFGRVAELSHRLEDLLDDVRSGRSRPDASIIDALLAGSDELERAIHEAVATGVHGSVLSSEFEPGEATASSSPRSEASAGGPRVVWVRLRADAAIKAARAVLIVRSADRAGVLAGHEPAEFDDDFAGELLLRLLPGADEAVAEAAIRSAGEVDDVAFQDGTAARPDVAILDTRPHHVRVERRRLDDVADGVGELSVLHARLERDRPAGAADAAVDRMGSLLAELHRAVLAMRMVPLDLVFDRLPRLVRDVARALRKDVHFEIEGGEIEVDRAIADEVRDPLVHLLRNAVDHGIETASDRVAAGKPATARLSVKVTRERSGVRIDVMDDGRGISGERVAARARDRGLLEGGSAITQDDLLRLISSPGFSTAERVTDVSGRGVGLDVVASRIRALGGALELTSTDGAGSTFTLRIPVTLALAQALRVRIGGEDYAIPLTHVREAVEIDGGMLVGSEDKERVRLRDELLPLVRLRRVLDVRAPGMERAAVVAEIGERRAALAVDELVGREHILIKGFDSPAGTLPVFSGVTLLADGRPALILDPLSVL